MDSTGTPGACCRLGWRTQLALGSGAVLKPFSHGWTTPSSLPWSCITPARSAGLNPATCAMTSLEWRPMRLTRSASARGRFRCEVRGELDAEVHVFPRRGISSWRSADRIETGTTERRIRRKLMEGEVMRLWQNNRLDGTFEAPTEQIVSQFRVSAGGPLTSTSIPPYAGFSPTSTGRSTLSGTTRPTWLISAPKPGRTAGPGLQVRGRRPSPDTPVGCPLLAVHVHMPNGQS